jgi:hypothetical protein
VGRFFAQNIHKNRLAFELSLQTIHYKGSILQSPLSKRVSHGYPGASSFLIYIFIIAVEQNKNATLIFFCLRDLGGFGA